MPPSICGRRSSGLRGFERFAAQHPEGLQNDGYDDRFHSIKKPLGLRHTSITGIQAGQQKHDQHGGNHKTETGQKQPAPARAQIAEMDGHFR